MPEEMDPPHHLPASAAAAAADGGTGDDQPPSPPAEATSTAVATTPPPPLAAAPPTDGYAVTLNIWPPSQRTRDAVILRLVETLSSPSVLSKRYGSLSPDAAEAAARRVEDAAFAAAADAAAGGVGATAVPSADAISFGIEILQIYSKEISKRMLEEAKSRVPVAPPSPAADSGITVEMALNAPPIAAVTDEAESVETEAGAY